MAVERSDIELVMKSFGCDEKTAVSFIDGGINVGMLRDGIDSIVEPEIRLGDEVKKMADSLAETVTELQKNS